MLSYTYIFTRFLNFTCLQSGHAVGDKPDHVPHKRGIPQLMQKCITYSLRLFYVIKLLENIKMPPGFTQQQHLQKCKEFQR